KSTIFFSKDSSTFSNKSPSQSLHFSKANSFLLIFGGMLHAIIAASTKKVPEPHIGSKKFDCPFQPLKIKIPAAKTSLIGAILVAVLYPLWCNDAPDVS